MQIIGDPRLQTAEGVVPQLSTAIDESFVEPRHLGDVRMSGHAGSVRQHEAQVQVGMLRERFFEGG